MGLWAVAAFFAGLVGRVASTGAVSSSSSSSSSSEGARDLSSWDGHDDYSLDLRRSRVITNRRKGPIRFDAEAVRRAPGPFRQAVRRAARHVVEEHAAASAARGFPDLRHTATSREAGQLLGFVRAFECSCPYEAADCAFLNRFEDFLSADVGSDPDAVSGTKPSTNVIISNGALIGIPFSEFNPAGPAEPLCADFLVASDEFSYSYETTSFGFFSCDAALEAVVDVCENFALDDGGSGGGGGGGDSGAMDDDNDDAALWAEVNAAFFAATGHAPEDLDDDVVASLDSAAEWACTYRLVELFACLGGRADGAPCGGGPELCDAVCTGATPYRMDFRPFGLTFCDAIDSNDERNEAFSYCCAKKNTPCPDSPAWHKKGDTSKGCDWVAQHEPRCQAKGEDKTQAWYSCPGACGTSCADADSTWYKAGDGTKDCAWVSHKPEARCDTRGWNTAPASAGCPAACASNMA